MEMDWWEILMLLFNYFYVMILYVLVIVIDL